MNNNTNGTERLYDAIGNELHVGDTVRIYKAGWTGLMNGYVGKEYKILSFNKTGTIGIANDNANFCVSSHEIQISFSHAEKIKK